MSDITPQQREKELRRMSAVKTEDSNKTINTQSICLEYIRDFRPIILYGPPGTGKSRLVDQVLTQLKEEGTLGLSEVIQFHKEFTYQDFIEGFSPTNSGGYEIRDGVFKSFCNKVRSEGKDKVNILVIDEVNRADISAVFGEALYLLEDRSNRIAVTAHSHESFSIPENIAIVGTMNTADKNIALVDFALRRRFNFIPLYPSKAELGEWLSSRGYINSHFTLEDYCKAFTVINRRICNHTLLGKDLQLGQSFFVPTKEGKNPITIEMLYKNFIYVLAPQIEAYTGYGFEDTLSQLLNPLIANKIKTGITINQDEFIGLIRALSEEKIDKQIPENVE